MINTILNFFGASVANRALTSAYTASDQRQNEIDLEKKQDVMSNPPSNNESAAIHNEYKRSAHDALAWAKDNLPPEEYKEHRERFFKYLKDAVPEDDGKWSNGTFTHQYSRGAPDEMWHITVLRGLSRMHSTIPGSNVDPGEKAAITAHNRRAVDKIQEACFRVANGIPDSPRASSSNDIPEISDPLEKTKSVFFNSQSPLFKSYPINWPYKR